MPSLTVPQSFSSLSKISSIVAAGLNAEQADLFFGTVTSIVNVGSNGENPLNVIADIEAALAAYPNASINWNFNSWATNGTGYPGGQGILTPSAYNAGTTYTAGQTCSSAGTTYIATATTTGNAPPNSAYWLAYDLVTMGVSSVSYDPETGLANGTPGVEQDALQFQNYTYVQAFAAAAAAEGLAFELVAAVDCGMANLSCTLSTAVSAGAFTSVTVTGLQNYVQGGDTLTFTLANPGVGNQTVTATVTGAAGTFQGGAATATTPVTINCTGTAPAGGIPIGTVVQDGTSAATTVSGNVTANTTTAIPIAASRQWWIPGDQLKLYQGANTNTLTVASVSPPGSTVVTVTAAPSHSYTSGAYLVDNSGQGGGGNSNTYKYTASLAQQRGAWSAIQGVTLYSIQSQQLQGTYSTSDPTYMGAYSSATTYPQWALVTSGGYMWLSLAAGNLNNTPSGQSAFWTQVTSSTYTSSAQFVSGMASQAAAAAPATQLRFGLGINPTAPSTRVAWTDIAMGYIVATRFGAVGFWHNNQAANTRNATVTGSASSPTITDSGVVENEGGCTVTGTNIPAGSYVGSGTNAPTPGVSWTLVDVTNTPVNPTGTVTGAAIVGVPITVYATFFQNLYTYLTTGVW